MTTETLYLFDGRITTMKLIMDYTAIDLEMTGLAVKTDKIIEIGAVKVRSGQVTDTFSTFVKTPHPIPERISQLTGITADMLVDGMEEDEALMGLFDFMGEDILLGQNFGFDYTFLQQWAVNHKMQKKNLYLDTLKIARTVLPKEMRKDLESLCNFFGVERALAHRAFYDAGETHEVYLHLCDYANDANQKVFEPRPFTYRVKKISPVTGAQLEQIKKYRETHHVTEPLDAELLTRSEASRLMERYYQIYGR